jgi:hypothetical protein|tara:strand:+ start:257 stop:817 length:561 start_codon:yes stop_codon:yes gene_type:complete
MLLQVLSNVFFNGIILLTVVFLIRIVASYILFNGKGSWVGITVLISLLLLFTSCSKEEIFEDVCGDCQVNFDVPFELDKDGYYHATLRYNVHGIARFNIDTYASLPSTRAYMYTIFKGDITLNEAQKLDMVQHSRLNHDDNGFTRRIVGPVPIEYIGDTLTINVDTYWEGNSRSENSKNILKFIIE